MDPQRGTQLAGGEGFVRDSPETVRVGPGEETIEENAISANNRLFVVASAIDGAVCGAVWGLAETSVVPSIEAGAEIVGAITLLVCNFLLFYWICVDASVRAYPVSRVLRYSVVVFGVFTLAYYFLRTRGVRCLLRMVGLWLLLLLASHLIFAISFFASAFALIMARGIAYALSGQTE